ncbi:MAG: cupin domain-containing protein, partial [Clostridiales bacterium]|nr:cupin domain-containing protein [Clostridiales bacterium]
MVPEKFISDNFGFVINWNEEEKSIAISKNSSNKNTDNKTIKENIKTINNIFEKGEVNPFSSVFTGKSYLSTLVPNEDIFNSPSFSNVTFEPCTRTDWHSHDGGQILLVTEGEGLYQEEGKQAVFMKPGDVIMAKPGVKHWHGASKDSWFAHIAISTNPNTSSVNWQEKVSDEEYNKAFDDAKKSDMHKNDTKHIFPVGELNPMSDVFTGISYLSTLVPTDDIFNCPFIANVTFEPCTRTDWHSH